MVKRTLATVLAIGLVGGALASPALGAKKKKPKAPVLVQVDQQMFVRGEACTVEARSLSLADNADAECIFTRAGILYDAVPESAPAPVGANPWQVWPAVDGVPLKLDTSKHITGEVSTSGLFPLVGDYPGISAGQVRLTIKFVGVTGGEEKELGEFVDEFVAAPGAAPHTSMVDIALPAELEGAEFESITMMTRFGGASAGHGVLKLDNPSSFVKIPVWSAAQ